MQSPQVVVNRMITPTLVIHSSDDLRCRLPLSRRNHPGARHLPVAVSA